MDNVKSNHAKILWLTRTAVFLALLVSVQSFTAPLGNQIITGSLVNMLLAVSAVACGMSSGLTVACVSPVLAKLFGIGPLWELIPFIVLGNAVFVAIWSAIGRREAKNKLMPWGIALASAAVAKFALLFFSIVKLAVPVLLQLPEKQSAMLSTMFSVPQLVTALIGGAVAIAVLIPLQNAKFRIQNS